MQICHRHKGTAVHGLTFLFVTSKHTVHPWWHGTSLISLHLFPTLHRIPHWIWMFFISTHPGCLHRWHKHHFSCEDLDLSADSAAFSAVADRLKYGHLPMCCSSSWDLWRCFHPRAPAVCYLSSWWLRSHWAPHRIGESQAWVTSVAVSLSCRNSKEWSKWHLRCAQWTKMSWASQRAFQKLQPCIFRIRPPCTDLDMCSFLLIFGKN